MEQDRFDALAKKVFDGGSRRRVIGGALASVLGVGVAAVAGTDAKNKKAKAQGKTKKGKAKGEFVCAGDNSGGAIPTNPCVPGSCCQSTPAGVLAPGCIPAAQQSGSGVIGDQPGGNGVCKTCPAGTLGDIATGRCVCSGVSCPDGCCIDNSLFSGSDQCIANGSGAPVNSVNTNVDGAFVCGVGGVTCEADSSFCGYTLFSGCCTANGACSAGTSNSACGSGGGLCETCQNDSSCGIDQACTGGTTTPSPTTTTTVAPCPVDKNGNPKIRCGNTCCGRKQECKTADDGTQRCKRKKRFL